MTISDLRALLSALEAPDCDCDSAPEDCGCPAGGCDCPPLPLFRPPCPHVLGAADPAIEMQLHDAYRLLFPGRGSADFGEELTALLWYCDPQTYREPPPPPAARSRVGSQDGRVEVMAGRATAGQGLRHPRDQWGRECGLGRRVSRRRNGSIEEGEVIRG